LAPNSGISLNLICLTAITHPTSHGRRRFIRPGHRRLIREGLLFPALASCHDLATPNDPRIAVDLINSSESFHPVRVDAKLKFSEAAQYRVDLGDIHGQQAAKRALEVGLCRPATISSS
jgi:hypothetical protein